MSDTQNPFSKWWFLLFLHLFVLPRTCRYLRKTGLDQLVRGKVKLLRTDPLHSGLLGKKLAPAIPWRLLLMA